MTLNSRGQSLTSLLAIRSMRRTDSAVCAATLSSRPIPLAMSLTCCSRRSSSGLIDPAGNSKPVSRRDTSWSRPQPRQA